MLELYAIPYSCSLAAHLCLRQRDLDHRIHWITRGRPVTDEGEDFLALNPKGKVATLRLDDGELVTENVTVLLEIDRLGRPEPRPDAERRQLTAWLSFIATELHKQIVYPAHDLCASESMQAEVRERLLPGVLEHLDRRFDAAPCLMGEDSSVADAYAWWALWLLKRKWPEVAEPSGIARFLQAMKRDPALKPTLDTEGAAYLRQRTAAAS